MIKEYYYFVEGECEKKLVETLKQCRLIIPGKVKVFNVVQELIGTTLLRTISSNAIIILLFDTDTLKVNALKQNIQYLRENDLSVICVTQVKNLEDELLRCTTAKTLKNLLNCRSNSNFKQAFIAEKNLFNKLEHHQFDIEKIWSTEPPEQYQKQGICNQGKMIKTKQSNKSR